MYRLNDLISQPKEYGTLLDAIRQITNFSSSIEKVTLDGELIMISQGLELNELQYLIYLESEHMRV